MSEQAATQKRTKQKRVSNVLPFPMKGRTIETATLSDDQASLRRDVLALLRRVEKGETVGLVLLEVGGGKKDDQTTLCGDFGSAGLAYPIHLIADSLKQLSKRVHSRGANPGSWGEIEGRTP